MRILLTNDDGFHAAGLQSLAVELAREHEVYVVAPHQECSNCGHCVTVKRALSCTQLAPNRWVVDGWPADWVRIAQAHLKLEVDFVLSGINHGGNLGVDIAMSGTCAAAREAAFHGLPAIAVSQVRKTGVELSWETSSSRAAEVIAKILSDQIRLSGYWNVNLPAIAPESILPVAQHCLPELAHLPISYEQTSEGLEFRSDYHARPRSEATDVELCFRGIPTYSFIPLR